MSWQPPPPPPKPTSSSKPVLNFYQVLQVDFNAHLTIIRYAYRFLAAMYHPDNVESGDVEKFKIITEAWRTLSDATSRQAYDMQLGVKVPTQPVSSTPTMPDIHFKPGLSWSEVELRLAILQVLLEARRRRPQTGGATPKMLMDCLNVNVSDLDFVLWYLREKGYITRSEASFMITVSGIDYLIDQLSKTQPLDAGKSSAPLNVNLPAITN